MFHRRSRLPERSSILVLPTVINSTRVLSQDGISTSMLAVSYNNTTTLTERDSTRVLPQDGISTSMLAVSNRFTLTERDSTRVLPQMVSQHPYYKSRITTQPH